MDLLYNGPTPRKNLLHLCLHGAGSGPAEMLKSGIVMGAYEVTVYRNSTVEIFNADGLFDHPAQVRIGGGTIAISYELDGVMVVYDGHEVEPGHFRLTADKVKGRATLHRFTNDDVLDGWWLEDGYEGMWRVTLEE